MSLTIGYTNTATNPATGERDFDIAPINFGSDFRVLREGSNEVVLTNINAPMTEPETIRFAFSEIADVFKGTPIEKPTDVNNGVYAGGLSRGCSLLVQMNGVGTDENGARFPYSAHLVLKVPYAPDTDADNIEFMLKRLIGSLYETGATTPDSRLASLLRGALTPTEL